MNKQLYKIQCSHGDLYWSGSNFDGWKRTGKKWSLKGLIKWL